jgi:hypothetical protein
VRGAVGAGFPVFIKTSAHDGWPGGVQPDEAALVAAELDRLGIDAIEVSAGTPEGARRSGWDHIMPAPIPEGRFFAYALAIKEKIGCPVISVEGWRDPRRIAVALERIDAVSLCRPFIREPRLTKRWRDGDLSPAKCISCNKCLDLIVDRGLGCIFHKRARGRALAEGRRGRLAGTQPLSRVRAASPRLPAGSACACRTPSMAARRGHLDRAAGPCQCFGLAYGRCREPVGATASMCGRAAG